MNRSLLRFFFGAIVVGAASYIYSTSAALPDPLASHFAFDGHANGRMSREAYQLMMTGLTLLIPLLMVFFQIWLPRRFIRFVNIPRRDYWLANDERKAATINYLERHALVTSVVPPLFFAALHRLVVEANTRVPPRLDNDWFVLIGGLFVLFVVASAVTLGLHFRRTA